MRRDVANRSEGQWTIEDARQWERVRQRLHVEVGDGGFDRFFKSMTLLEAQRGRIRLGISTRFLRDFVTSNFGERLYRLWRAEKPDVIAVDIVVDGGAAASGEGTTGEGRGAAAGSAPPRQAPPEPDGARSLGGPALAPQGRNPTGLIPSFSFENFVMGPSNALAYEAAKRVAENPGVRYNPLFIYGPTGVGKTHLEHAIGNAILTARPNARVRYLSAERFLVLFVLAVRGNTTLAFKDEYRSADVLLIDDFQYIAGASREATQNEFLHTLNALIAENRQVVISADHAPGALHGFDESMRSRLGGGMIVDVANTDSELRLGILQTLVQRFERLQSELGRKPITFAPDVLPFLAERLVTNGRELTGAFNRLSVQADIENVPVTVDFVQKTLRDVLHGVDRPPTIDEIQHAIEDYTGVRVQDQRSARRTADVVRARHMAWWLCRHLTERSYPQIAQRFGNRDHTTIIAGVRRIDKLRERDSKLVEDLEALIQILSR